MSLQDLCVFKGVFAQLMAGSYLLNTFIEFIGYVYGKSQKKGYVYGKEYQVHMYMYSLTSC
jgi:hypothetical protein